MITKKTHFCVATPWACYRGLSGPFGPEVSLGVSPRVSPKTGVSPGVSHGVSPGALRAAGFGVSKKCPESVAECLGHLFDTPGTLSGHFLGTPRDTLGDTPVLGTLSATLPETLRARKAPRDPCSRPRGSQLLCHFSHC